MHHASATQLELCSVPRCQQHLTTLPAQYEGVTLMSSIDGKECTLYLYCHTTQQTQKASELITVQGLLQVCH